MWPSIFIQLYFEINPCWCKECCFLRWLIFVNEWHPPRDCHSGYSLFQVWGSKPFLILHVTGKAALNIPCKFPCTHARPSLNQFLGVEFLSRRAVHLPLSQVSMTVLTGDRNTFRSLPPSRRVPFVSHPTQCLNIFRLLSSHSDWCEVLHHGRCNLLFPINSWLSIFSQLLAVYSSSFEH